MESLKIEDLEKKIQGLSQQVILLFKTWPEKVPEFITLYNGDEPVLETFKGILHRALESEGYSIPIFTGAEENGYSIDVYTYLRMK